VAATVDDIFKVRDDQDRPLFGVIVYSRSIEMAELAGHIGFDVVWIGMEHGPASHSEVQTLCCAVEVGKAIPAVRIQDGQRTHVLRALEVGARIVIVPMINNIDQARAVVEYGKYPPLGRRGFFLRSRGVGYGLKDPKTAFAAANATTHLFVQIETAEAVENLQAICSVEGLSGIIIGPGDLSASLGRPAEFDNPELVKTICDCIRRARDQGKRAGVVVGPGPLMDASIEAGADMMFVGGDIMDLAPAWTELLTTVRRKDAKP